MKTKYFFGISELLNSSYDYSTNRVRQHNRVREVTNLVAV